MPCCASAHTKWGPHTNTHLCRSLTCCPASQEFFGLQVDPGSLKKRDSESDSLHKKQSGCRKHISPGLLVQLWRRDQTGKFHSARRGGSLRKQVIWTGFCNIRGHSQETRPHKPNRTVSDASYSERAVSFGFPLRQNHRAVRSMCERQVTDTAASLCNSP